MGAGSEKKVLVVGATGFLGPVLVDELLQAGFQVVCGVRNLKKAAEELCYPGLRFVEMNLNADLDPEIWHTRLRRHKIDRVVNNVGIANSFGGQSIENVNVYAPLALFEALRRSHLNQSPGRPDAIPRVIQISTTGVSWPDCSRFPYPASKLLLEKRLGEMAGLSHVIVRPNVIYEPERGHLLLEQIARIPVIFYIGRAQIQPIHCREVAIGVARLLQRKEKLSQNVLQANGPGAMSWREVFAVSSAALGRKHLCYCSVPLKLAQIVTWMIQQLPEPLLRRFGILSKMDPETMVMMTRGSTGSNAAWLAATGMEPMYLFDTYRRYARGAADYAAFVQQYRDH